jgi:hypothetical protein
MEQVPPRFTSLLDISSPVIQRSLLPFLDTKERVSLSRTHSSFYDPSFNQTVKRRVGLLKEVVQNIHTREESLTPKEKDFFNGFILESIRLKTPLDLIFRDDNDQIFTVLSVAINYGNTYLIKKIIKSGVSPRLEINGITYLDIVENIRSHIKRIYVRRLLLKYIEH